jgi:hypothetical protein
MKLWPIFLIIHTVPRALCATESSGTYPTILTPDFVQTVQQTVDADGIPGLALAIVYKNGSSELGAWGIKDEDGTNMTTDVRYILAGSRRIDEIMICLVDALQYRLLLKGLPLRLSWDPDQRFYTWTEHDSFTCGLINTELEDKAC